METMTLKNGSEVEKSIVQGTMIALEELLVEEPIAFAEFVKLCRNKSHELFGSTPRRLKERGLLGPDGKVDERVQNVVVSAVQGDITESMELGKPGEE